jgi:hypothetical protein
LFEPLFEIFSVMFACGILSEELLRWMLSEVLIYGENESLQTNIE